MKFNRTECRPNENTVLLDTVKQFILMNHTGIPYKAIRGYEEDISSYSFGLYQVYYTKWAWEHRDPIDVNLVFNNRLMLEKLEDLHKTSIMYLSFSVFIFVFVSPILLHFEGLYPDLYTEYPILRFGKPVLTWYFRLSVIPVILLITNYNSDIW